MQGTMLIIGALVMNVMASAIVLRSTTNYPQIHVHRARAAHPERSSTVDTESIRASDIFSAEFLLCESGMMSSLARFQGDDEPTNLAVRRKSLFFAF